MSDARGGVQSERAAALSQARAKAQQELQMTCDRRRRAELERTLASLDQAIAQETRGI